MGAGALNESYFFKEYFQFKDLPLMLTDRMYVLFCFFSPYELPPHTPFLDDSPEYGLHGYQLHVDMHSGGVFCLCGTFDNLFTKKGETH